MNTKSPYYKWLLKQRVYCDLCLGPMPATEVIKVHNKYKVVCDAHFRAYAPLETGFYALRFKDKK